MSLDDLVELIVDQLDREYGGDAWHGTPLRQLLLDVGEEPERHSPETRSTPRRHSMLSLSVLLTALI